MNHLKPGSSFPPEVDDIPEARRDPSTIASRAHPLRNRWLWIISVAVGLTGISASVLGYLMRPVATATEVASSQDAVPELASDAELNSDLVPGEVSGGAPAAAAAQLEAEAVERATMLGHRKYDEIDASKLVPLRSNAAIRMHPSAAAQVDQIIADAKAAGIPLGAASGFRSWEQQRSLFFDVKAERGQSTATRAEVSAPPGYSEHHTGYAIDFIDVTADPADHLELAFEDTRVFAWLTNNASRYGFEMSFPKDNPNISYEPWHWRYVGDAESLEVFFQE